MLLINKGREPKSLTAYRKTKGAYYDGCNKDDIRESLLREQGYLCAYCMRRIHKRPEDRSENEEEAQFDIKIEHWIPQNRLTEVEKMDYRNMLGVCQGHKKDTGKKVDTCDAQKGDKDLFINPLNSEHIRKIIYKRTGEIYSDEQQINEDLNHVLNLNCVEQRLPENRKATLNSVIRNVNSKNAGSWTKSDIRKIIEIYEGKDSEGKRKPYAGIVLWYFRDRMRQID